MASRTQSCGPSCGMDRTIRHRTDEILPYVSVWFWMVVMRAEIAALALVFLGIAHSVLGEKSVLRPLFRSDGWSIGVPRSAATRLLRMAWHATSIAWFALAAIVLGTGAALTTGYACLATALLFFLLLREHLAWPIFLAGGLAALAEGGALSAPARWSLIGVSVLIAVSAAAVHVYWAVGGKRWLDRVIPTAQSGQPAFRPGAGACLAVVAALLVYAGLIIRVGEGNASGWESASTSVALAILMLRAVGDGRQVGFTKSNRSTAFARADDRVFTPLVVGLSLGAVTVLL